MSQKLVPNVWLTIFLSLEQGLRDLPGDAYYNNVSKEEAGLTRV